MRGRTCRRALMVGASRSVRPWPGHAVMPAGCPWTLIRPCPRRSRWTARRPARHRAWRPWPGRAGSRSTGSADMRAVPVDQPTACAASERLFCAVSRTWCVSSDLRSCKCSIWLSDATSIPPIPDRASALEDRRLAVACPGKRQRPASGRFLVLYPQLVEQDTKRRCSLIVADPFGHQVDAERVDQRDPWHVLHDLPVDVLPEVVSHGSVGGL